MINIFKNFPGAVLNHTLHWTMQHSAQLMEMNGRENISWYSEEGLGAKTKDIRNCLERLSRKCYSNYQDVHLSVLEGSGPYWINITSKYTNRRLWIVCKFTEHTVHSHGAHQFAVNGPKEFFMKSLCRNVGVCLHTVKFDSLSVLLDRVIAETVDDNLN